MIIFFNLFNNHCACIINGYQNKYYSLVNRKNLLSTATYQMACKAKISKLKKILYMVKKSL